MNRTEGFIYNLYRSITIKDPDMLSIGRISNSINLPVHYWDEISEAVCYKSKYAVFIDQRQSKQQQWQEFGHECCHIFNHVGNQNRMRTSFLMLQESQADYFSKHFCIPTFMLFQMDNPTVYDVANAFNVEHDFARARLEMYQNNIIGGMQYVRA